MHWLLTHKGDAECRALADRLVAALVARMQGAAAARGVRLEHRPAAAAVDVWVDAAQLDDALRAELGDR